MNKFIELDKNEVLAISGGLTFAGVGEYVGGYFGIVAGGVVGFGVMAIYGVLTNRSKAIVPTSDLYSKVINYSADVAVISLGAKVGHDIGAIVGSFSGGLVDSLFDKDKDEE